MTIRKDHFSGSTNGLGVQLTTTDAASGVTVHTTSTDAAVMDELYVYAVNLATEVKRVYLMYGSTDAVDVLVNDIPSLSGLTFMIPGLPLENAKVLKAYAETANVIVVHGHIHRITVT